MEDKQILLDNINKVHTTEMGINRQYEMTRRKQKK